MRKKLFTILYPFAIQASMNINYFMYYWIGIVLLFSFVFPEKIFPMESCFTKVLSLQHKGQTILVKSGESFLLTLPSPGAGGYLVHDPEFNSQILTLLKKEKKSPSEASGEGDFGSLEWSFLAKEKGISTIIVQASRPWERGKVPIVLFEVSIQVNN